MGSPRRPSILFIDIETSPNLGWIWEKYEQNVIDYQSEWELLSIAYKWLGKKKVHSISRRKIPNEASLVKCAWKLLSDCDFVIGHNGDEFDLKKLRAKFVQFKLPPPRPFISLDTKKIAKKYFKFNSNSLNDLCRTLGIGRKAETGGFTLWQKCMAGDKKAYLKMESYNRKDVVLLEKVYLRLRPYIYKQPGISIAGESFSCPNCQSYKVNSRGSKIYKTGRKRQFQCQECGAWFSATKPMKNPIRK